MSYEQRNVVPCVPLPFAWTQTKAGARVALRIGFHRQAVFAVLFEGAVIGRIKGRPLMRGRLNEQFER